MEIEQFNGHGQSLGVVRESRVVKPEAAWRAQLSSEAYAITREAGTERAYSGAFCADAFRWSVPLHLLRHGAV